MTRQAADVHLGARSGCWRLHRVTGPDANVYTVWQSWLLTSTRHYRAGCWRLQHMIGLPAGVHTSRQVWLLAPTSYASLAARIYTRLQAGLLVPILHTAGRHVRSVALWCLNIQVSATPSNRQPNDSGENWTPLSNCQFWDMKPPVLLHTLLEILPALLHTLLEMLPTLLYTLLEM